jgi:hypothetical protein
VRAKSAAVGADENVDFSILHSETLDLEGAK